MKILATLIPILLAAANAFAETPWERYLVEPTPNNAKSVAAIEYSSDSSETYSDFSLLESQVIGGDVEAFLLTLRLAEQADGGTLHDLTIIAARAIRSHPRMFLAQFEADEQLTKMLARVLVTVGEEYVDRPVARRYELKKRYEALIGIAGDSDAAVPAELLVVLGEAIENLEWASVNDREPVYGIPIDVYNTIKHFDTLEIDPTDIDPSDLGFESETLEECVTKVPDLYSEKDDLAIAYVSCFQRHPITYKIIQ